MLGISAATAEDALGLRPDLAPPPDATGVIRLTRKIFCRVPRRNSHCLVESRVHGSTRTSTMTERDIFIAALQISPTRTAGRVTSDRPAPTNAELRRASRRCCAAHDAARQLPRTAAAATPTVTRPRRHRSAEGPGTVIGPYKLLEQIGEGGMGSSSWPSRPQPVRRKVALKIIKPGMDTEAGASPASRPSGRPWR